MDCVLRTLGAMHDGKSATPRKKAKTEAFLAVLGDTDKKALLQAVRASMGTHSSSGGGALDTSGHTSTSLSQGLSQNVTSGAESDASTADSQFVTQKIPQQFSLQPIPPHSGKKITSSGVALSTATTPKRSSNTLGLLSSSVKIKKIFETNASLSSATKTPAATNSAIGTVSSAQKAQPSRAPLKSLPVNNNMMAQLAAPDLKNTLLKSAGDRANKWMKPAAAPEKKSNMQSALEERIGYMRQFISPGEDDENQTVTETMNDTGFGFF